jgi:hypothetical protein
LHVLSVSLPAQKFIPRIKQIVGRGDTLVCMGEHPLSHTAKRTPPPTDSQQEQLVPVVSRMKDAYIAWQMALPHVTKAKRQTIAARIDAGILDVLELSFSASYLPTERKVVALEKAISRLDTTKFLLLVGWESGAITSGQHIAIGGLLVDASKMLVGWKAYIEKKTSAESGRK